MELTKTAGPPAQLSTEILPSAREEGDWIRTVSLRDDSGPFFSRLGDALVTRSTGTNVGDIYLMISLLN